MIFLNQYLPFLPAGLLFVEPPAPAHNFLQAQCRGVSLSVALSHLWRALNDFLAASE
jgi:hypothetical protein